MRKCKQRVLAAATTAAAILSGQTLAATSTWTGGAGSNEGTYNVGNTGSIAPTPVNYYVWDATTAENWAELTAYAPGNDVVFNAASGSFVIASTSTSLNPNSVTFTGGATYDFTRATTNTTGSSNFSGWYGVLNNTIASQDTFSSSAFFNASASVDLSINLGTATTGEGAFTGTVHFRTRPQAIAGFVGGTTINSGTLEIHDGSALPAAAQNTPNLWMNGGRFNVNVDTGSYTYRQGNIAPSSGQLGGILTIAGNATLGNTAIDAHGRAREQQNIWNGQITIAPGTTLTVFTGGGTVIGANVSGAALQGSGTILLGTDANTLPGGSSGSNRLRLNGNLAAGSTTLHFDLGDNGILEAAPNINGTTNLGSLKGGANTMLRGSTAAATSSSSYTGIVIGANDASTHFAGIIGNGVASNTGGGSPAGNPPGGAKAVANVNLTKAGSGALTISGSNYYGGATTVNGGTLVLGSSHAIGGGAGPVAVTAGGTLDLNGNSQIAGRQYVLSGGSLVNNGTSPVVINSGASGNFVHNGAAAPDAASSGVWTGSGNTPTVTIEDGGGSGATAQVLLQLGWLRFHAGDGGNPGSGYTKEPIITFSDPDLPSGRPIKAVASLAANGSGAIAAINIIDPGYGYTSVPTISIDSTGTGGTGFLPVFSMTAAGIVFTNGGSGYTSAPTITLGGPGYLAGSSATVANFGQVNLTADSSIGGSGDMVIQPGVTGDGGLIKVGGGTVTLQGDNTYGGGTTINDGVLLIVGSLAMTDASETQFNVGSSGNNGTLASEVGANLVLDGTLTVNLANPVSTATWQLLDLAEGPADGFDAINLAGAYVGTLIEATPGLWTATIDDKLWSFDEGTGVLHVPEPSSLALLSLIGGALLRRRRRV